MAIPVCIETPTRFARYTVTDAIAIPLSTILQLSGTAVNTAEASKDSSIGICAGIAWEEKTASDGLTEISAALNGVWDIDNGGVALTNGSLVALSGANAVREASADDLLSGAAFAKFLEPGTASVQNRMRVDL